MSDTIKPCPHCGSPARMHRYQHDRSRIYYGCSRTDCPGHLTFCESEAAEAIEAWNRRGDLAVVVERLKRLGYKDIQLTQKDLSKAIDAYIEEHVKGKGRDTHENR